MKPIVQSLWLSNRNEKICVLSNNEILSIKSFLKNDHEYHLYVYGEIENIPEGVVVKDGNEIIPASEIFYYNSRANQGKSGGSVSAFSNMFRYKLLYDKGGYWVDTDMICVKQLDFDTPYVFSTEYCHRRRRKVVNAGIIKAPPGSNFAKMAYERCLQVDKSRLKWGAIGPSLVAECVKKNRLHRYIRPYEFFCPVHYIEFMKLVDDSGYRPSDEVYCVHLWNERWRRENLDKNGTFHQDSFMEYCKEKYDVSNK